MFIAKVFTYRYWFLLAGVFLLTANTFISGIGFTLGALMVTWAIQLALAVVIIGAVSYVVTLFIKNDKWQKGVVIFLCIFMVDAASRTALSAYTHYVLYPQLMQNALNRIDSTKAVSTEAQPQDDFDKFLIETGTKHPADLFEKEGISIEKAKNNEGDTLLEMSEEMADIASQRRYKTQDYAFSSTLLIQAAEKGNPEAQYRLGYMYMVGYVFPENRARAIYWLQKANQQKYPKAAPLLAEAIAKQSVIDRFKGFMN